jgi:hypothetical protein
MWGNLDQGYANLERTTIGAGLAAHEERNESGR